MTTGQIIAISLFTFLGGIGVGQLIGEVLHFTRVQKSLKSKCKNCKFFEDCQGFAMRHNDENKNCVVFQEVGFCEENYKEKLEKHLETLTDAVQENSDNIDSLYEIASDSDDQITRLEKEVFNKNGKKKTRNRKRK